MSSSDSVFLYWCRPCQTWWNAEIAGDEAKLLRRHQRSSPAKPGEWHHPGQAACPACGEPSTQHLPTEHSLPEAARRNPQFRNATPDAISHDHAQVGIPETDGSGGLPVRVFAEVSS